jgi:2-oxoacid dehydrogenases acyltransferase (catalytic domain)
VDDAPGYRRFMPALMPTRNGSVVYFDQCLRVHETERFLASIRETRPDLHPTLFHVVLWALARMFDRHPRINRFVAGGRLYQRDSITIAFTVKSELTEDGTLLEVKHRFDPSQPFVELVRDLRAAVASTRGGAQGRSDRELEVFLRLPPALRRGVVRIASAANAMNLLPRSFIEGDPFFASAFVTNLGSVGLDAAFHHLYEYGTIPIFGALGKVHETVDVEDGRPVVARTASMKFTYDERVEDGLYAAHAIADFQTMVEHPNAT